jgi:hypothetical protein
MPEEKATTKHARLKTFLKWFFFIFRCFFACLFAALLIAGLLYVMPGKILLIFTFTLITLTLFPKRIRKLVWLGYSVILLAALIWVLLPEDDTGFVPYTFDDELAALEAERTIGNAPNAAEAYNEVFDSRDKDTFDFIFPYHDKDSKTLSAPWLSADYPRLDRWFNQNRTRLDKLIDASAIQYCRFPLSATPSQVDDQLERLSLFKRWATVLIRAANNDLAHNRLDDALYKQLAVMRMADHLYQQKTLLDMSAGLILELLAAESINQLVIDNSLKQEHLDRIAETKAIFKNDIQSDWLHILQSDKLLVKNIVGLLYHTDKNGRIRLTRNLAGAVGTYFGVVRRYRYPTQRIAKAMVLAQWLIVPSNPKKAGRIIDRSFEKYDRLTRKKYQSDDDDKSVEQPRLKLNFRRFVDIAVHRRTSYFHPMYNQSLRRISTAKSARIIIALKKFKEQNGSFPQNLDKLSDFLAPDDIIDPVSEDTFVYRPLGQSFMLYSKGKNKIDDDGISYSKENKDDHLIFPPKHPLLIQQGQKNEM